jgi:hypothetical protein
MNTILKTVAHPLPIIALLFSYSAAQAQDNQSSAQPVPPAASAASAPARPTAEAVVLERIQALEGLALQVSKEAETTFQLYRAEITKALNEAKVEVYLLRTDPFFQQCSEGINRSQACLIAIRDSLKIVDAAFHRHNLPDIEKDFRRRLSQISDIASQSVFAPLPETDPKQGILRILNDEQIMKRVIDLQRAILQAMTKLGSLLSLNSTASISSRAVLDPMKALVERPANEKVDVVGTLVNGFDAALKDLSAAKLESEKAPVTK